MKRCPHFFILETFLLLLSAVVAFDININEAGMLDGVEVTSTGAKDDTTGDNRIIGGSDASPNEYPFFVSVRYNNGHLCGGTLIHQDIVLTAAHCQAPASALSVIVNQYSSDNSFAGSIFVGVAGQLTHPSHSFQTNRYDFQLLKLSSSVTSITPVQLNFNGTSPAAGDLLTALGMGNTVTTDAYVPSDTLQEVQVYAVSQYYCQNVYFPYLIDEALMLCAMAPGKDSCQGDSGGPILSANKVQLGLVSFGRACADEITPGVYARVSSVQDWIKQSICSMSASPPANCTTDRVGDDFPPLECTDGMDKIPINGRERNCWWLSLRPSQQTLACVAGNIAYTVCRETCGTCGV